MLQKKFKERYEPPDILNFAQVGDVFATKQGEHELVRDYISRIQRICLMAKLDAALTLKAVLNGLLPTPQTLVMPKEPKMLADVEKHTCCNGRSDHPHTSCNHITSSNRGRHPTEDG